VPPETAGKEETLSVQIMLLERHRSRRELISARIRAAPGLEIAATPASAKQALSDCSARFPDLVAAGPDNATDPEFGQLRIFLIARGIPLLPIRADLTPGDPVIAGGSGQAREAPRRGIRRLSAALLAPAPTQGPAPVSLDASRIVEAPAPVPDSQVEARRHPPLICIGASTGGLPVVQAILERFPENGPPVLVVQHIRPEFLSGLAERLERSTPMRVREAYPGAPIRVGRAYIAPGGTHHLVIRERGGLMCQLVQDAKHSGHRPSIDVLFHSVAEVAGAKSVGVLLTGMGRDGAEGLLAMRRAGARTIAQDRASSTVFGMPRVAAEIGAAGEVLPASRIADAILETSFAPGGSGGAIAG
jgi:two-component system, chemotaxis family, protein-glutamate methylesterase/glutaminase